MIYIVAHAAIRVLQTRGGINGINLSDDKAERGRSVDGEQRMGRLEGRHETVEVIGSIGNGVEVCWHSLTLRQYHIA